MTLLGQVSAPAATQSFLEAAMGELYKSAAAHEAAGRLDEAARVLGLLLEGAPEQADALHLAGVVACRHKRWDEALNLMQRSMARGANTPLYLRNIAEVYRLLGRLDEALNAARRAVMLNPVDPVVLSNLSIVHASRGEDQQAEACARAALDLDPGHVGAHFGLAELLLSRGDMVAGWDEYEWRFKMPGGAKNLPPHGKPQWDGRALAPGRLLVVADQGFGDGIQFGRYLPWVIERCPAPHVACSPPMRPILAQLGAQRMFSRWDAIPEYDAYVPLSGLPRLAGATPDTIPAAIPYLQAEPSQVARWKARLASLTPPSAKKVGLVWAGRPEHGADHKRSMRLGDLRPLLELDDVVLVSLQKGPGAEQVGGYLGAAPLVHIGPALLDWTETMAVLVNLDVIVTVDTAVAHLAGALGCRVMLLLPRVAEWRWLRDRNDTPWYPTMRLYRQKQAGIWIDVAQSVATTLSSAGEAR